MTEIGLLIIILIAFLFAMFENKITAAHVTAPTFFIAAFVAGLTFGNIVKGECKFIYTFSKSEGQMLVWAAFSYSAYHCCRMRWRTFHGLFSC